MKTDIQPLSCFNVFNNSVVLHFRMTEPNTVTNHQPSLSRFREDGFSDFTVPLVGTAAEFLLLLL
jgi:hypothetical protein